MLLHMTNSMAAFTAARGNPSGRGVVSSHLEIVSRVWLVSMFVYMDFASAVNSQQILGSCLIALSFCKSSALSFI